MAELPTGTVTFVFTDLEGSTRSWEELPEEAMSDALARHDEMLRKAFESRSGVVFSEMGDGMAAAFPSAPSALQACLDAQLALAAESWPEPVELRVRMGVHAGDGQLRADGQYVNTPLNRCARLMGVAHGGQVVCSDTVESLVRGSLPTDVSLLDLGVHRLRDLAQPMHVYQLVHPGLRVEFPRLGSLEGDTNLPVQVTSFVGRERELAELSEAAYDARIVTLTGVGGVGKTRLALQVAAEVLTKFEDGACFVDLAPLVDPDAVHDTIATALGTSVVGGMTVDAAIVEDLRRRAVLLVLDNCEHVLEPVARLVDAISRNCPRTVVLATSREGLAIPGERIYAVGALSVPDVRTPLVQLRKADAVRLFVDRAAAVRSDFALTEDNRDGVVAICRRLDGVPLALELAAARVTSLHPAQIAERLDERFRILTAGRRTAVARHQTLRATIDWSYDLLTEPEQRALSRMAVFAGGCTLDAAEAVLAASDIAEWEVVEILGRLVEQSLVLVDEFGTQVRYRLFETIRQYAAEQLAVAGDTEATLARHAAHYREVATVIGDGLQGQDENAWVARYETELENLRGAITWFASNDDADDALGVVFSLFALKFGDAMQTIDDLAVVALEAPSSSRHPLGPSAMVFAAEHAMQDGHRQQAAALLAAATEAQNAVATPCHPMALYVRFRIAYSIGELDEAATQIEQLDSRPDMKENGLIAAWTVLAQAAIESFLVSKSSAAPLFREATSLARATSNPSCITMALASLAWAIRDDAPEEALSLLDEAIAVGTTTDTSLAVEVANRFVVHARLGQKRSAITDGRRVIAALERLHELNYVASVLANSAIAFAELARPIVAATLFAAAGAYSPVATNPAWGWQSVDDRVRNALGTELFDECSDRGRNLDKDAALALIGTELDGVESELTAGD